jgi:hypothetical protein
MGKKIGLAVLLAALSGVASAGESCRSIQILWITIPICTPTGGKGSDPVAAPEIDPASMLTGLTLALGGLAVLRGRRLKDPQA